MQFRKVLAAGSMAALMAGASIGFAQLDKYPAPFVSGSEIPTLVVVGATAAPADVVGAIDLSVRLGGEVTTLVKTSSVTGTTSVSGEGKAVATTNTKLFLDDTLGKSGLRSTMTKDDLPTLLATGTLNDADASTTHKYQQFIYLTPGSTTVPEFSAQFEKPSGDSTKNPTYSFGDWTTAPTPLTLTTGNAYMYRTSIVFDKELNGTTAVGEKITMFGKEFTILSDTTFINGDASTSNKLVISGGAETKVLKSGENVQVTLSGKSYDVTMVGTSSSTAVVLKVGSDQKTINKGSTTSVGGLDIFVDDVFQLSSTDQSVNSAKLLLGAQKMILQHGSKVKVGTNEDTLQGSYVNLTVSSGKLASFNVYVGGASSDKDFLALGGEYQDPVWKTFKLAFPSVTPGLDDATNRNTLSVDPSGDNLIKATIINDKGETATVNWGYKSASTGTLFDLADSSGYRIHVVENETIANNEYFIVDAGDFSHMFQVSTVNLDSTTSAYIDLRDVFSGTTLRVSTSSDNKDSKVIDGQTYYFTNRSSTTFAVTWGTSAADNVVGTYTTVFPVLKGKHGEKYAFVNGSANIKINDTTTIQLPGGALGTVTIWNDEIGSTSFLNLSSATQEDGTASACPQSPCVSRLNVTLGSGDSELFNLSRTSTGGLVYNISASRVGSGWINISVAADQDAVGAARTTQPGIVLMEEKDDSSNVYYAFVAASTETSGSNNVAIPTAPEFTAVEDTDTLGSDSNINRYVDLYGTYAERKTSGQDSIKIWYPDEQTTLDVFVLAEGATTSASTGATGSSVKQAVPVKTSIAKLDTEVTTADKTTKNVVLVGGPAVNSLVRELATAGKTKNTQWYLDQGPGTTLVDLVSDAFTSGRSALVVAGYNADDTRTGTGVLQNYDAHASELASKNRVVWKNGVVSTTAA